jgi:hypothetical protein
VLGDLGARPWQIELTAPILVAAIEDTGATAPAEDEVPAEEAPAD